MPGQALGLCTTAVPGKCGGTLLYWRLNGVNTG